MEKFSNMKIQCDCKSQYNENKLNHHFYFNQITQLAEEGFIGNFTKKIRKTPRWNEISCKSLPQNFHLSLQEFSKLIEHFVSGSIDQLLD